MTCITFSYRNSSDILNWYSDKKRVNITFQDRMRYGIMCVNVIGERTGKYALNVSVPLRTNIWQCVDTNIIEITKSTRARDTRANIRGRRPNYLELRQRLQDMGIEWI